MRPVRRSRWHTPALGAFIANDDNVAGDDLVVEDRLDAGVLAFEDASRTGELEDGFVNAGRLHDAAVQGNVAIEDRKPAILRKRVLDRPDDAAVAIRIQFIPA